MNQKISRREFATVAGSGVVAIALGSPLLAKSVEAVSIPDTQMKAVLDELTSFNAPPIEKLSPMNARNKPTVADAVIGVLAKRRKPAVEMVGDINHQLIPGPGGDLLARIYLPIITA